MLKSIKKKNLAQKFYCPWCEQRLWRLGSPKFQTKELVPLEPTHLSAHAQISDLTVEEHDTEPLNSWQEEFFCEIHDRISMEMFQKADSSVIAVTRQKDDRVES